jgi:redox-sensing transcriptional repressor
VRKDLAITGIVGRPKKGYPVLELIQAIERFLGWDTVRDVALVGAGNLGMALMGYGEFKLHGLRIVIAFDQNPQKIGATIRGIPVFSIDEAETRIRKRGIKTAILTVPSGVAQDITDRLVGAGIEGIWNFTNIKLKTPPEVVVQKEDLSSGYAMLCVMMRAAE